MSKIFDEFVSLNICVLTVSDTRNLDNDLSGRYFENVLLIDGHTLYDRKLVKDDIYEIRAVISNWIFDKKAQVILITGGTGFADRDSTPEAIIPLLDKSITGFGELFREISKERIGTSTLQSRSCAGLVNKTLIFSLPGSTSACEVAWNYIISEQLNALTRPCNFVSLLM